MEFSKQEYWRELPFPSPKDLANPGIGPESPALQADSLPSEPPGNPLALFIFVILTVIITTLTLLALCVAGPTLDYLYPRLF